jgi:regulatory protein
MKNNASLSCAIRLLTRREHGAWELGQKLAQKGFSEEEIQIALRECQRLGLQSDARFSESMCRLRMAQGYGALRIRQELQAKRVAEEWIEQALSAQEDQWIEQALKIKQKKYKSRTNEYEAEIWRQKKFLHQRGFPMEVIDEVLRGVDP